MTDPKADTLPAPDMRADLARTLAILAGAATSVSVALPAPGDIIARLIAAGLGVAGLMLREGATPQQAVDAIKRVRHIDTSADDAAVDRKVDAKPIGKRYQEMRPVMQAVPVESLGPPAGLWSEPGEGD